MVVRMSEPNQDARIIFTIAGVPDSTHPVALVPAPPDGDGWQLADWKVIPSRSTRQLVFMWKRLHVPEPNAKPTPGAAAYRPHLRAALRNLCRNWSESGDPAKIACVNELLATLEAAVAAAPWGADE